MISPLIYKRIKDRAKSEKMPVPKNYEAIIQRYKSIENIGNYCIAFSWLSDSGSKILNASAMVPGFVLLNAEWAARIVLFDNESTMNAFKLTVGHELTHKEKEINRCKYKGNDRKFIAQVNEVHADFGAVQKMCGSSRFSLLDAINYKKKLKVNDDGDFAHPPWWKRYEYVERYNLDKELIYQIAADTGCDNKKLKNYVTGFYENIILTPPPKEASSCLGTNPLNTNSIRR